MKNTKLVLKVSGLIFLMILSVSCNKKQVNPYMKEFSNKMYKAVYSSKFSVINEYFGELEDFSKMISNCKTPAQQKKLKKSWEAGALVTFRKMINDVKKDAGKLKRVKFIHLAYNAPEDPTIINGPVKLGYFSLLPTRGYITFRYWTVGEKIIIVSFKYKKDKPTATGYDLYQLANDHDLETFESNCSIEYQD